MKCAIQFFIFLFASLSIWGGQVNEIVVDDLQFWTESFGDKEDPALLLVSGGGSQAVMWPDLFCEKLQSAGFFVIRYDLRDMGLSSSIDYATYPYDLLDLAEDAVAILDAYGIEKAHALGASMGGSIVMLLGAYFPERVLTITPMIATSDLRTVLDPKHAPYFLSTPKQEYMDWLKEVIKENGSRKEKIALYLNGWRILNGYETPFDEDLYTHIVTETMKRMQNPKGFVNHFNAMKASIEMLENSYSEIDVPVLIIQGTSDPIFSIEHGEDLAGRIPGSELLLMEGMGHNLNPCFYDPLISALKSQAKKLDFDLVVDPAEEIEANKPADKTIDHADDASYP